MSVVGELDGLEEMAVAGRVLWRRRPIEAVSEEGSFMGVKAETGGGRKMVKDFLRRLGGN